jgi:hypothetical protein
MPVRIDKSGNTNCQCSRLSLLSTHGLPVGGDPALWLCRSFSGGTGSDAQLVPGFKVMEWVGGFFT